MTTPVPASPAAPTTAAVLPPPDVAVDGATLPTPDAVPESATDEALPAAERVLRLAVVLTGGVSLAVWMGGVVTEIQRLTQRSPGFRELCELTATHVEVDVIGGSSAGGINGAILALALAHGADASAVREIWVRDASLHALLRDPRGADRIDSFLRGDEYFLPHLRHAFDSLGGESAQRSRQGIELLLTGTLLDGVTVSRTDDFGSTFTDTVHRAEFRFRRDPAAGTDDFADPQIAAKLALAARATSSFPGAFEPTLCPVADPAAPVDLGPHVNFAQSAYVIDGGVLVNKPLLPVLDTVVARDDPDVDRVVCYIQPAPDHETAYGIEAAPALSRVVQAGWFSLPHAESLARELRELDEHNERVVRHRRRLLTVLHRTPAELIDESARLLREGLCNGAPRVSGQQDVPNDAAGLREWPWSRTQVARALAVARAVFDEPRADRPVTRQDPRLVDARRSLAVLERDLARLRADAPPDALGLVHLRAARLLCQHAERMDWLADLARSETYCERWLLAATLIAEFLDDGQAVATEPVELLHISAEAGNGLDDRSRPEQKLAGLQLQHFGAFYKSAWRANDWMWGRLDGIARLVQMLLAPARLAECAAEDPSFHARCLAAIRNLAGEPVDGQPGWDEQAVRAELEWLADPAVPVPSALPRTVRTVVRALQLSVVEEELPRVAESVRDDAATGHRMTPTAARFLDCLPETTNGHPERFVEAFEACQVGQERIDDDRGSPVYERFVDRLAHLGALAARRHRAGGAGTRRRGRHRSAEETERSHRRPRLPLPGQPSPAWRTLRVSAAASALCLAVIVAALLLGSLAEIASVSATWAKIASTSLGVVLVAAGACFAAVLARRTRGAQVAAIGCAAGCALLALLGPWPWRLFLLAAVAADVGISVIRRRRTAKSIL